MRSSTRSTAERGRSDGRASARRCAGRRGRRPAVRGRCRRARARRGVAVARVRRGARHSLARRRCRGTRRCRESPMKAGLLGIAAASVEERLATGHGRPRGRSEGFWRVLGELTTPKIWLCKSQNRDDRASVYGTEGHRFESCRARRKAPQIAVFRARSERFCSDTRALRRNLGRTTVCLAPQGARDGRAPSSIPTPRVSACASGPAGENRLGHLVGATVGDRAEPQRVAGNA